MLMKWGFGVISVGCFFIMIAPTHEGSGYAIGVVNGLILVAIGCFMVWKGRKK